MTFAELAGKYTTSAEWVRQFIRRYQAKPLVKLWLVPRFRDAYHSIANMKPNCVPPSPNLPAH